MGAVPFPVRMGEKPNSLLLPGVWIRCSSSRILPVDKNTVKLLIAYNNMKKPECLTGCQDCIQGTIKAGS